MVKNTPEDIRIRNVMIILTLMSTLVRGIIAGIIELGNDEVYYWTYALFPDLSHFDHPPMVGMLIQATTLDLLFDHEFFIRLGPVMLGGINTWLIYLIGRAIKDSLTGLYAALLYTSSVYCFVISGIFMLPDTAQGFFWLLTLWLMVQALPSPHPGKRDQLYMFLTGITVGLAMLSKYTSVFLWVGIVAYVVLFNRVWLRRFDFYLAMIMSAAVFSPVIMWNIENDFISFTFHGERVSFFETGIRPDFFLTELSGQILYNNPINFGLIILGLIWMLRRESRIDRHYIPMLLLISLPLILLFLFFSFFRQTLPHWTGPSYLGLILVAGSFVSEQKYIKGIRFAIPKSILAALILLVSVLILGVAQINHGIIDLRGTNNQRSLGKTDPTLDMFGWKQLAEKFREIHKADLDRGTMDTNAVIISYRWFPAAHQDYYLGYPLGIKVLCIGNLERIHKYAWINRKRGGFPAGTDAYYITSSRDFSDPAEKFNGLFSAIDEPVIVNIQRGGKTAMQFYIFRLHDLLTELPDPLLPKPFAELEIKQPAKKKAK